MFLLVGKFIVGKIPYLKSRLLVNCKWSPRVVALDNYCSVGHSRFVTRQRVRRFECGVCETVLESFFKPWLLVHVPCSRDIPCGQPSSTTSLTQAVATLVTHSSVDGVATFPRIGTRSEERHFTTMSIRQVIVNLVLFARLLEISVIVRTEQSHLVLHAHTIEIAAVTVGVVHFHTSKEVHDVVIVVNIVIACCGTEVPAVHLVLCLAIETTIGQY